MFIPDGFKADVLKFFSSPAGQAFMIALRERRPKAGDGNVPFAHSLLNNYAVREGYDVCLSEIPRIPQESAQQPESNDAEAKLTDPRN